MSGLIDEDINNYYYTASDKIGRGASANIYRAKHLVTGI